MFHCVSALGENLLDIDDSPMWFGESTEQIFGWLAQPMDRKIRGAVVLVPTIGFEARNSRIAFAHLSRSLARAGFASLRFDYRGLGDSSGDFATVEPDPDWLQDIRAAVDYFRTQGVASVSLVAIRLGATLSTVAIERGLVQVDALTLLDPCESGNSYLREQVALRSVRQEPLGEFAEGTLETTEFLVPAKMASLLRPLTLTAPVTGVQKMLLVHRSSNKPPKAFRSIEPDSRIDLMTTDEQDRFFAYLPWGVVLPTNTMSSIVEWLDDVATSESEHFTLELNPKVTLVTDRGVPLVRECAQFLGDREVFAITTDPVGESHGPLILLIGNINDDHTGPSRIFTDCARRWARSGLRCVRMDLSGIGESTRHARRSEVQHLDRRWTDDVGTVIEVLQPENHSNTVIIGICASSTVAYEAGLRYKVRGIGLITPPLGRNVAHAIYSLQESRWPSSRMIARILNSIYVEHFLAAAILWGWIRRFLPLARFRDVARAARRNGTSVTTFGSLEDLSPRSDNDLIRRFEGYYFTKLQYPKECVIEDLDHNMTSARGRINLLSSLDAHIQKHYGS